MRQTLTKRLISLLLSVLLLLGSVVPVAAVNEPAAEEGTDGDFLVSVSDTLSFITYEEYLSKFLAEGETVEDHRATESFVVSALDYDKESTTAEVSTEFFKNEDGSSTEECLTMDEIGETTWKFNVPQTGFYTISIRFAPVSELSSDVERIFYINGKVPFQETRHIAFRKTWSYTYPEDANGRDGVFEKDAGGNELRPEATVSPLLAEHVMKDLNGFYLTPFEYYLEEGENTLTLESIRDDLAIASFTFAPYEAPKTYEETKAEYEKNGYTEPTDVEAIHVDAETPDQVSNYTIYPISDRTSAVSEPQHQSLTILNTIGRDKWVTNGQWIRYTVEVEKDGLYVIAPRYKQSFKNGIFVSREVKIDGKVPFEEASSIRFDFDKEWKVAPLSDEDGNPYEFYLTAGTHTIEFAVSLGDMSKILHQANLVMESINNDYLEITKLTGQEPDVNRDYGFARVMPLTVADLSYQSQNLRAIVRMIEATSGVKSDTTGTLNTMVELLRKMGADESKIASNMSNLVEQISSLGAWVNDMSSQPLEMDYILIQPASAETPDAEAGFFESLWFEILKFFASFFSTYTDLSEEEGTGYEKELLVWTSSGRDQAQIINNLIKDGYGKINPEVNVTLKLTAANSLLLSILAGVGPDVSIDSTSPLDMAIRGALVPLDDFDTFEEVASRFTEAAMVTQRVFDETYAIPTGHGFSVMFYREDILADLGMEVPKTWDELMAMVPVFEFNNMNVGLQLDMNSYIFQATGGTNDEMVAAYWNDGGMSTALDKSETLDAIETYCNFFTQYSLPMNFDGVSRMRTGEMPIFVSNYGMYNQLVVAAPEIAGLWKMAECPGVVHTNEDGTTEIVNCTSAAVSGIAMPISARDREESWKFMDWFTDKDYQVSYSNEMVTLLGNSAKQSVANLEAFEELPWTTEEKEVLIEGLKDSVGVPPYPGDYMAARYTGFVLNAAYSQGADPSDLMQDYVSSINKEMSRKRKEFGLVTAENWDPIKAYTGFEKYSEWCAYEEENGIEDYESWMEDIGISSESYEEWSAAYEGGDTTLDYKSWITQG